MIAPGRRAVRQLASRARRHVARASPRHPVSAEEHRRLVEAFARAAAEGDLAGMLAVLDPDVIFTADGGGLAAAARKPLRGAARVARVWIAITRRSRAARAALVTINGRAGLLTESESGGPSALAFAVDAGRITRIHVVRNPEKLRRLGDARR